MIKFTGPKSVLYPHSRLLYKSYENISAGIKNIVPTLQELDQIIQNHPQAHFADSNLYVVLFGYDSEQCWVGRDVIGHFRPTGKFSTFDSYKSDGYEWESELEDIVRGDGGDIIKQAEKLKSLGGEELAKTWRIKIGPIEDSPIFTEESNILLSAPFQISFQFYKINNESN